MCDCNILLRVHVRNLASMAMNRNRFKYNKPRSKPQTQGYWIEARKGDPDNGNLVTSVIETCLNERALWQNFMIASTSLYINTDLEQKFSDKEKELEGVLKEKPPQMFAFGLVRTKGHADEIVNKSAYFRHILHVPLGDLSKGVNLVKHADVLMTFAAKKRCQRPWLIVYRVMVGRSKNVKPRFVSQAPQVNPTPNADSHVCKDVNTKSNLALEQLNQSQIFLYELDNKGRPIKHPRHCLPYAVISWKQRDVPLSLTPNPTESRRKVNAAKKDAGGNGNGVQQENSRSNPATQDKTTGKQGEEEAALSRLLDDESLTLEDLNSTQLDSKLSDIKKEREAVMAKLKAIQNMREQLASGSCSSESEQEIDKTLDKIAEKSAQAEKKIAQSLSSNGPGKMTGNSAQMDRNVVRDVSKSSPNKMTGKSAQVDRKIVRSMSSSGPDSSKAEMERQEIGALSSQDGNQFGRSNSLDTRRQERIASTSGWRDPYHWTPYERNQCDEMYGGGGGFDYYQNDDEQADMFDLEEMLYAGKIPLKAPARVNPPAPPMYNNAPGKFHEDFVQVPKSEGKGSGESGDESNRRPQVDGHKIESEIGHDNANVESNNSSLSTFNKDVVPKIEPPCQNLTGRELESSAAGGDNQLSSNIQVLISSESPCKRNASAFHHGVAPASDASHQNHNTMPDIKSNMSGGDQSSSNMDVAGGDNQPGSNIQVQDMDIDESSQSSTSRGSSQIHPIGTQINQAVNPPPPAAFTSQSFPAVYASQCCSNSYNMNTPPPSYTNSTMSSTPAPVNVPPPSLPSFTNSTVSSIPAPVGSLPLSLTYKNVALTNSTVSSVPAPDRVPPPSLPYNNVAPTNSTVSSIPAPIGVPPPGSALSYNNVAPTNSTINSIHAPIGVPPPSLPFNNVAPTNPSTVSSIPAPIGVPPPSLPYNNTAPMITQDYNSFNYDPSHEGAPTISNVPPQQNSSQEPPNSDPLGLLGTSYQPPPYSTPTSSTDTPRSDFSAGKVVARDADGRLRLLSQSESPVEAPKVVFVKPPSPPSGEQGPEAESNSKIEDAATALSAINTLQAQMINSNNPNQTKAHALQMIMNTLLTKMVATQKANATKSATSSSQGDVQSSKSGLTGKASPDVPPKPKKPVKMFHGHPLIRKGAKKPPRPILLEQLSDEPEPVDPRPARSSLFGRKFEASLDVVPWAKTVRLSPTKITKIDDHSKRYGDGTQMPTQLRDPRLHKQVITKAPTEVASVPKKVVTMQPTAADTNKEELKKHQQKSTNPQETSHKNTTKQGEESLNTSGDTEIEVLGKYRSHGRETPESGELSDSATDEDVRTVVMQRNHLESRKPRYYKNMGAPGDSKQQNKMLDKFKYVQNLNALIPDENTDRKVKILSQPQDTVFDRLGMKRKRRSDENKFDLRNRITGRRTPDAVTGYAVRDQFLISESSNDSSIVEVKSWSPPPPPSTSTESFADSFKWYDRKPEDIAVAPEPADDKYRKRKQNSGERHANARFRDNEHEKWREQQLRGMNWTDGMDRERNEFHGEWRLIDGHWQREERPKREFYGDRNSETYQREHGYPFGPSTYDTFGRPQSWQHNQRSRPTSPARSGRSLSKERSSRSHQRHSVSDTRSSRGSAREERLRTWSSTGSYPRDRSLDRLSTSSQRSRSRDRASIRSGSSMSSISLDSGSRNSKDRSGASPISWDIVRRPPSRGSSTNSPRETNATRPYSLLDERLEKEHGIAPSKKRKLSTDSVPDILGSIGCEQQKVDGSVMYRNLCSSLAALKQSVTKAARSFKDLNRNDLKAKVERYQERYKKLQDTAIKALEVHYEQDREPSELDRDIQQRLLEMITDIESQSEGLDKYKTSSDGRSKDSRSSRTSKNRRGGDVRDKSVSSRSSTDLASQMYDRRQTKKYSTYNPVRSNSGSSQKKRCP